MDITAGGLRFLKRWQAIKARFSMAAPHPALRSASLVRKREAGMWQRRYWEHTIRDDRDYVAHMDYVHFNPVKHGLAPHPSAWPYSSFRRCVEIGLYPAELAPSIADPTAAGERR